MQFGNGQGLNHCPWFRTHYRAVQRQLLHAKRPVRRPSKIISLSNKSLASLKWWVIPSGFAGNCIAPIRELQPTVNIWTDANMQMGGSHNDRGQFFQREWTDSDLDIEPHINLLETRAAREGVAELSLPGDRVRLFIDNTTACAYIRKQGGTRCTSLSEEACLLWEEAALRNVTVLTPQWIGTKDNVMADFLTRNKFDHWEFTLDANLFSMISQKFGIFPTLDAFASNKTARLPRYMSWQADSMAVARNAMLAAWDPITYLFPPTPMLLQVVQKVRDQRIRALLVCPRWPSALWWTLVVELMVEPPIELPHYLQALHPVIEGNTLPYLDPLVAVHLTAH